MELVTAVITGDRAFQIRVFAEEFLSLQEEQKLTSRLCRLTNLFGATWARYKLLE